MLAIANMAECDIYHLNLSLIESDTMLDDAFASLPGKCVVVFEDVDCMCDVTHRRTAAAVCKEDIEEKMKKTFTLSALLNHIDGSGATHGRIVTMTSNHVDVLDPALIRPGRTDVHMRLGMCSRQQIRAFFGLFFPDVSPLPPMLQELPDNVLSPAEVSSAMLQFRNRPMRAIERLTELVEYSMK